MHKTAYVVEGYVPNGGTYMAYHVARILHVDFGYDVRVVTADGSDTHGPVNGLFHYDPVFPCVPLEGCSDRVREDDVLICNPSFSSLNLGLKVRGRKLMYVQGFTTFSVLDCFFDRYVAVSGFVRDFLAQTYDIEAPVIPAFVPGTDVVLQETAVREPSLAWEARPPFSIELNFKGNREQQLLVLERVRGQLRAKDRALEEAIDWDAAAKRTLARQPHREFLERIRSARYLLTLSVAEGFGLVPLEAMGQGTVVLGFDGYGGREYMAPGRNCAVASYPDVAGVVDGIINAMRNPVFSCEMMTAGIETASRYTYDAFRSAWVHELGLFLSR